MATKQVKKPTGELDLSATVRFLSYIAQKITTLTTAMDSQVNILVGISAAIFVFATSRVAGEETSFSSLILSIFSGFSTIVCLLAVHPPRIVRQRRGNDGMMNIHGIEKYPTVEDYADKLREVVSDPDEMMKQFSFEIYNRAKFYYRPKRNLYRLARNILLLGVIFGLLGYVVDVFLRPFS